MTARVRRVPGKPAILSLRVLSRKRGKKVIAFFLRRNWRQARVLGIVLSVPDLLVPGEPPADVVPASSLSSRPQAWVVLSLLRSSSPLQAWAVLSLLRSGLALSIPGSGAPFSPTDVDLPRKVLVRNKFDASTIQCREQAEGSYTYHCYSTTAFITVILRMKVCFPSAESTHSTDLFVHTFGRIYCVVLWGALLV